MGLISGAITSSHLVSRVTSHLVTWCDPLPHQRLMVLGNVTFLPIPLQELSPCRLLDPEWAWEEEGLVALQSPSQGPREAASELNTLQTLPLHSSTEPQASPLPPAREGGLAMT